MVSRAAQFNLQRSFTEFSVESPPRDLSEFLPRHKTKTGLKEIQEAHNCQFSEQDAKPSSPKMGFCVMSNTALKEEEICSKEEEICAQLNDMPIFALERTSSHASADVLLKAVLKSAERAPSCPLQSRSRDGPAEFEDDEGFLVTRTASMPTPYRKRRTSAMFTLRRCPS
eukprot:2316675-Rhodomonas_salina.1